MVFDAWMRDVRAREREAGVDFRQLACYGSKLTPHVQDRLALALKDIELLYATFPSRAVNDEDQRTFWETFRPEYIRRMREALDLFAASLVAVGCTGDELTEAGPDPEDEDEDEDEDEE